MQGKEVIFGVHIATCYQFISYVHKRLSGGFLQQQGIYVLFLAG